MNTNIYRDFQICISLPLTRILIRHFKNYLQRITLWTFITEICKNLWLKCTMLKLAYHPSSWIMFSSLSKNHTLPTNNFAFQVEEDTYRKIWRRNTFLPCLKLWNLVSNEYKTIELLADFKAKIKTWVPENCPCRLCKTYIQQASFIWFPSMIVFG